MAEKRSDRLAMTMLAIQTLELAVIHAQEEHAEACKRCDSAEEDARELLENAGVDPGTEEDSANNYYIRDEAGLHDLSKFRRYREERVKTFNRALCLQEALSNAKQAAAIL